MSNTIRIQPIIRFIDMFLKQLSAWLENQT
nr:MAG TPA: hypothetical protein [Bacteriophage sp.]DAV29030.1 MAG TPA: hypothetical protein [Caudoviricetes sp.]